RASFLVGTVLIHNPFALCVAPYQQILVLGLKRHSTILSHGTTGPRLHLLRGSRVGKSTEKRRNAVAHLVKDCWKVLLAFGRLQFPELWAAANLLGRPIDQGSRVSVRPSRRRSQLRLVLLGLRTHS